jgi:ParB-like chromosome segregation protein Spo0J
VNYKEATMAPNDKRIERRALDDLKPHPRQSALFSQPPEGEVKELADDLRRNGQQTPVEALPDGTLLCGHKRVAAARQLGWAEVDVWVREDLAGDPVTAEQRLIEDNLNRRQLGPLGKARCYKRLKELERKAPAGRMSDRDRRELRDRVGKQLDVSGRTLDRFLRILEHTPQEVQDAVEAEKLPLTVAERVASLKPAEKERVAEQIRAGFDAREAVDGPLKAVRPQRQHVAKAKYNLVRDLDRALKQLSGRVGDVIRITDREDELLAEGGRLIADLRARGKELKKEDAGRAEPVDSEDDDDETSD